MKRVVAERIANLLQVLTCGLQALYGDRLRGLYLFGSYARGEADDESDVDALIVLDGFNSYAAEVDRVSYLTAELSLEFGLTVNVVFASEPDWLESRTAFLENVREEAVPA